MMRPLTRLRPAARIARAQAEAARAEQNQRHAAIDEAIMTALESGKVPHHHCRPCDYDRSDPRLRRPPTARASRRRPRPLGAGHDMDARLGITARRYAAHLIPDTSQSGDDHDDEDPAP